MSPFEYKSGSNQVTVVIVSVIRFTPQVSGLCQSGRQQQCTQESGPKYSVSQRSPGSDGQEEVRKGECTFPCNSPWCNNVFVHALPTLIKTFLVGYTDVHGMHCQFMYSNDPRCNVTCGFHPKQWVAMLRQATLSNDKWLNPLFDFLYTVFLYSRSSNLKCRDFIYSS